MSRTFRNIPTNTQKPLPTQRERRQPTPSFIQKTPDGKRNITAELIRDNRATGLRSHREDRRAARVVLRTEDEDVLPTGKMRKYSLKYGNYKY